MDGLKEWRCKNGHILGQVKRNGRGIRQLLLYRHAVNLEADQPEEVDVIGYLEGTMMNIQCDVAGCGEVRTWEIGKDAIERVIRSYAAE